MYWNTNGKPFQIVKKYATIAMFKHTPQTYAHIMHTYTQRKKNSWPTNLKILWDSTEIYTNDLWQICYINVSKVPWKSVKLRCKEENINGNEKKISKVSPSLYYVNLSQNDGRNTLRYFILIITLKSRLLKTWNQKIY